MLQLALASRAAARRAFSHCPGGQGRVASHGFMRAFPEYPAKLECRLTVRDGRAAFTLIELLMVIAVIALLAGLTFGLIRGATERANRSQATAELAVIAAALESYQRHYGDYPRTESAGEMLQALEGTRGPTGTPMEGRALLETVRFTTGPGTSGAVVLLDPWGNPYFYRYAAGAGSYVLLSAGPDGEVAEDGLAGIQEDNMNSLPANR